MPQRPVRGLFAALAVVGSAVLAPAAAPATAAPAIVAPAADGLSLSVFGATVPVGGAARAHAGAAVHP